jgi:hypothetical protein
MYVVTELKVLHIKNGPPKITKYLGGGYRQISEDDIIKTFGNIEEEEIEPIDFGFKYVDFEGKHVYIRKKIGYSKDIGEVLGFTFDFIEKYKGLTFDDIEEIKMENFFLNKKNNELKNEIYITVKENIEMRKKIKNIECKISEFKHMKFCERLKFLFFGKKAL